MRTIRDVLLLLSLMAACALAAVGPAAAADATSAFLFQRVSPAATAVRAGTTTDGLVVTSSGKDVLSVMVPKMDSYGDPTISRLSNGRWATTAWTGAEDSRGGGNLLYNESSCPAMVDSNAKAITASSAAGCNAGGRLASGKTSQIFDVDGSNYVITSAGGTLTLVRLTDATRSAADLSSICVLSTPVTSFSSLKWGEGTKVFTSGQTTGLLMSDSGIARRADGTWVLFVKGISATSGCAATSLCELCARNIYRSTSTDLITWSALEKVAGQASVPDAVTYPDGKVWLYHQDFGPTCTAEDLKLAERAPILGLYETADLSMSASVAVTFPGEDFTTDTKLHFPTNGNPVNLPDAAARASYEACMSSAFSKLTVTKSGTGSGTVTSVPTGISCGATCSQDFITGNPLTFTATADSGSAFTAWGGACEGTAASASCTVAMDAAKSVTATFTSTVTVPDAPTLVSVTAGVGNVSIVFTAPSNTGGAAITSYTGTCAATGLTSVSASNTRSPLGMSGLVPGVPYSCSVTATNSVGTSAASASMSVTPAGTITVPICSLTASPSSVEMGSASTLAVTCSPAATSLTWGSSVFAANATGGSVKPFYSTDYSVQGSNASGKGNTATATVTVTDTATYSGKRADYTITGTKTSTGYSFIVVDKVSGASQTYTTHKRLKFSDTNIALDIDGVGGQAYRLYQAAFARTPDLPGLGFQMWAMDKVGWSLADVAGGFLKSPEFISIYGSAATTDLEYVTALYTNVLGRPPEAGGLSFYLDGMAAGHPSYTRNKVLTYIAESPENKGLLLPKLINGFEYTPTEGN